MIILDTNVMREVMQPRLASPLAEWIDAHSEELWLNTVSLFETRYGLERMPEGARRRTLEQALANLLQRVFRDRIAPLDKAAGEAASRLAARSGAIGRTIEFRDALIAGITFVNGATLATRDFRHFQMDGLRVVDPFAA